MDSRAIKLITINYILTLLILDGLMEYLSGYEYFSNIDLKSGYYQIKIQEVDECKTSFKMK